MKETCTKGRETTELLDYVEGLLSRESAGKMEAHLAHCPSCSQAVDQYRSLSAFMIDHPEVFHPAAEELYAFVTEDDAGEQGMIAHLEQCPTCREDVELIRAMVTSQQGEPASAGRSEASGRAVFTEPFSRRPQAAGLSILERVAALLPPRFRLSTFAAATAAAAALLVLLIVPLERLYRSQSPTAPAKEYRNRDNGKFDAGGERKRAKLPDAPSLPPVKLPKPGRAPRTTEEAMPEPQSYAPSEPVPAEISASRQEATSGDGQAGEREALRRTLAGDGFNVAPAAPQDSHDSDEIQEKPASSPQKRSTASSTKRKAARLKGRGQSRLADGRLQEDKDAFAPQGLFPEEQSYEADSLPLDERAQVMPERRTHARGPEISVRVVDAQGNPVSYRNKHELLARALSQKGLRAERGMGRDSEDVTNARPDGSAFENRFSEGAAAPRWEIVIQIRQNGGLYRLDARLMDRQAGEEVVRIQEPTVQPAELQDKMLQLVELVVRQELSLEHPASAPPGP